MRREWKKKIMYSFPGILLGAAVSFALLQIIFLVLTLMIGGILAFMLPDATSVSWDDGHHFQHALNYSTIGMNLKDKLKISKKVQKYLKLKIVKNILLIVLYFKIYLMMILNLMI